MRPDQRIGLDGEIHQASWLSGTPAGQHALARAHSERRALRCLCTPSGVDMYVARRGSTYYLARMPGTGLLHGSGCPNADEINLFSGAWAYPPGAIVERGCGGLDVAFQEEGPVSLEGLLDLLIENSGLNLIRDAQERRTWKSLRGEIVIAADQLHVPAGRLGDLVLVPTGFDKSRYAVERGRQEAFLSVPDALRLVCAPLRELRPSSYGWQISLKHMPDTRFWLSRTVAEKIASRNGGAFAAESVSEPALVLLRVRPASKASSFGVIDIALRTHDRYYLPCRSDAEAQVAESFIALGRRLMRPLRFDADLDVPLADFALLDCTPEPVPVLVLASTGCAPLDAAKRALAASLRHSTDFPCGVWEDGEWSIVPPTPSAHSHITLEGAVGGLPPKAPSRSDG